jgi:hypothetical protein
VRLSSLACAALWWMQVNTPLNVEAVRVALHSLPEGWKRWYPTLMVDGPPDTLMDLFKKALAGPDFVPLAQDFLAAFRAHSEGGETVTNNCYQLLCRVNHVKHGLASHDRLQQLFLRGSEFLPIAILIAAGIVVGPLQWKWIAGDVDGDFALAWSRMDSKEQVLEKLPPALATCFSLEMFFRRQPR